MQLRRVGNESIILRRDLTLLPLDGEAVAFSAEAQRLLGLNAAAALVVRALQGGAAPAEIVRLLAAQGAVGPDLAADWVGSTLDGLRQHGMLAGEPLRPPPPAVPDRAAGPGAELPPYAPFMPWAERRYQLLGTCALIRFGCHPQWRRLEPVLAHLAVGDARPASVTIDLPYHLADGRTVCTDVYRDGVPYGRAQKVDRLAPIVKSALWQSAIDAHPFFFYIHAGVVGTGAGCVLLPAPAGSGKSSLTMCLVHRGFQYFSDEVALIEPGTFLVAPMPLAMAVKSTGWDVVARYFPQIAALPVHLRSDAKAIRYVPPPAGAVARDPAPISHIIFPRYDKDAPPARLEGLGRTQALGRIMGECLAVREQLTERNVGELVAWIGRVECAELTFSSLESAADLVIGATGRVGL